MKRTKSKRSLKGKSPGGSQSIKERTKDRTKTIRKSRRLALKRRREARVSDVLGVSPGRKSHSNLQEAAAEQLAAEAAVQKDRIEARSHHRMSLGKSGGRAGKPARKPKAAG